MMMMMMMMQKKDNVFNSIQNCSFIYIHTNSDDDDKDILSTK